MAPLSKQPQSNTVHALCIGDNGSGKTGALSSLAKAGYKVRVLAFESGTEILANLLEGTPYEDNIDVELCVDDYKLQPVTNLLKATASAFPKGMKTLADWPGLGKPRDWGEDTVLVIDTLTSLGRACMNHVFEIKGKLKALDVESTKITQPDWGDAMKLQEDLMAMLMVLKCHVIVNAHVTFLTPDGEASQQGFPSALGSKLPPKIGGYFNHILYFTKQGVGNNKQRVISAKGATLVSTKTSAPGKVKDVYPLDIAKPLDGGLAAYFADVLGVPKK